MTKAGVASVPQQPPQQQHGTVPSGTGHSAGSGGGSRRMSSDSEGHATTTTDEDSDSDNEASGSSQQPKKAKKKLSSKERKRLRKKDEELATAANTARNSVDEIKTTAPASPAVSEIKKTAAKPRERKVSFNLDNNTFIEPNAPPPSLKSTSNPPVSATSSPALVAQPDSVITPSPAATTTAAAADIVVVEEEEAHHPATNGATGKPGSDDESDDGESHDGADDDDAEVAPAGETSAQRRRREKRKRDKKKQKEANKAKKEAAKAAAAAAAAAAEAEAKAKAAAEAAAAPPPKIVLPPSVPKIDSYQTPETVVLTVYKRGLTEDKVRLDFTSQPGNVLVVVNHGNAGFSPSDWQATSFAVNNETPLDLEQCKVKVFGAKVEVTLAKERRSNWGSIKIVTSEFVKRAAPVVPVTTESLDATNDDVPISPIHPSDTLPKDGDEIFVSSKFEQFGPIESPPPAYSPTQTPDYISLADLGQQFPKDTKESFSDSESSIVERYELLNNDLDTTQYEDALDGDSVLVSKSEERQMAEQLSSQAEEPFAEWLPKTPPGPSKTGDLGDWDAANDQDDKLRRTVSASPSPQVYYDAPDTLRQAADSPALPSNYDTDSGSSSWANFWSSTTPSTAATEGKGASSSSDDLAAGISAFGGDLKNRVVSAFNRFNLLGDSDDSEKELPPLDKNSLIAAVSSNGLSLGLVGLGNLGNTCFMNSTLQCLSATKPLVDYLTSDVVYSDINEDNPLGMQGYVAVEFSKLIRRAWTAADYSTLTPTQFKATIGKFRPQFHGTQQHDSQELLAFLLDGLHEDLNRVRKKPYVTNPDYDGDGRDTEVASICWENYRKRNDSIVVDLFQGQYKSTIICQSCSKVSVTFDPFMYLSLPMPGPERVWIIQYISSINPGKLPMKTLVKLPENRSSPAEILKVLSGRLRIAVNMLVLAELTFSFRFERIFDSLDTTTRIDSEAVLAVYDTNVSTSGFSDPEWAVLPAYYCAAGAEASKCGMCNQSPSEIGPKTTLMRCSRCFHISYCSEKCQKEHYKAHKPNCFARRIPIGPPRLVVVPRATTTPTELLSNVFSYLAPILNKPEFQAAVAHSAPGKLPEVKSAVRLSLATAKDGIFPGIKGWVPDESKSDSHAPEKRLPFTDKAPIVFSTTEPQILNVDLDAPKIPLSAIELKKWRDLRQFEDFGEGDESDADNSVTLSSCLNLYLERELLDKDNCWYCPACKTHREATKQISLWSLPDVLVIHLKRFASGIRGVSKFSMLVRSKLDTNVSFPLENLDLRGYLNAEATGLQTAPAIYDLFGVSNHFGGTYGGHYTAYTARKSESGTDWYEFDDSRVSNHTPAEVQTKAAYVLFYQRRK